MESIFEKTVEMPRFAALTADTRADVLVVGGGIAGILCAYCLKEKGARVVLVEKDRIACGVTAHTTAKISALHGLCYDKMIATFGVERAAAYYRAQCEALARYRDMAKRIDCDLQTRDSFVYSVTDRAALEREMRALEKIGAEPRFVKTLPLPFPTMGAVSLAGEADFHALRFLAAIAKDLTIFEESEVCDLGVGEATLLSGVKVKAENIVIATHFPILDRHGAYPLKMYQHRSYTLALRGAADVGGMYVDEDARGFSFRNWGEYLILGGAGHRTGLSGGGWRRLAELARAAYPGATEVARGAAQDCMTLDGIPYIGRYGKTTKGLFVTTGFGKWGMTNAMAGAMLLSDLIEGKEDPYAALFSPSRSVLRPRALSGLAVNLATTASHYLRPTPPRCPHLGCALSYNRQERSWDCPCHGSRFSEQGELLDNPAAKGLSDPPAPPKRK